MSALTFMNNVAPTPPTDIRETLTCRHTALTTLEFVICTHAKILLGEDIQSTRSILADRFKLAKTMSLLLAFFEVGAVTVVSVVATSSLSASSALAFAIAFLRVFVVSFFLNVFACLLPFGGGGILVRNPSRGTWILPAPPPQVFPPGCRMPDARSSKAGPPR
jgi:hypothetical protein